MKWSPRDIVAVLLACAVFSFVLSGGVMRAFLGGELPLPADSLQAWKDVINVILGALAGYIAGKGIDHE